MKWFNWWYVVAVCFAISGLCSMLNIVLSRHNDKVETCRAICQPYQVVKDTCTSRGAKISVWCYTSNNKIAEYKTDL